jgi:hypothetical protein
VYLDHWEERWADTRIHGRTKRQVAAMFAEEKPFLQPLPMEPFRYCQYGERTVHIDGCVGVEAAYYGAPPVWIGRKVDVPWDAMLVRLLDPRTGALLREHLSGKRGGNRIRDADRSRRTPPPLLQLLARAHKAGANIGAVCDAIHARQEELECAASRAFSNSSNVCAIFLMLSNDVTLVARFSLGRPSAFAIIWAAL